MNVNMKIESALKEIASNIWPLCCPDDSLPDTYIVYNPELEKAEFYADDTDQEWVQYIQVHLYKKGNYLKEKKQLRNALRNAGIAVNGISTFYEKETGYAHLCFECYIEEE